MTGSDLAFYLTMVAFGAMIMFAPVKKDIDVEHVKVTIESCKALINQIEKQ